MLHLVWGEHTGEDALKFVRELDETCAERWLCVFHPTVDVGGMDVERIPRVKWALDEKRKELFGDRPKPYALVCASGEADPYFDFSRRYHGSAGGYPFHSLDEAYDWLGLSEAARAAASATIQRWEAKVASGVPSGGEPV